MTLQELINVADEAYPDGKIGEYHSDPSENWGDGLARFIVNELGETFSPEDSSEAQLATAAAAMETAASELHRMIIAMIAAASRLTEGE